MADRGMFHFQLLHGNGNSFSVRWVTGNSLKFRIRQSEFLRNSEIWVHWTRNKKEYVRAKPIAAAAAAAVLVYLRGEG